MNSVNLSFRLVADPEEPREVGEHCVLTLRGVHNRKKRGEDAPVWIDVKVWNGWAKNFTGKKGDTCYVSGLLDYEEWEKDGVKRSKHTIVANSIFIGNQPQREDDEPKPKDDLPF